MKNSTPNAINSAAAVEPKAASARPVHPRELTLEQFRQLYFPELVADAPASANETAQRRAA